MFVPTADVVANVSKLEVGEPSSNAGRYTQLRANSLGNEINLPLLPLALC